MDVEFSLDVREFERKALALSALISVEPAEIVRQEMGSAVKTIQRYTYPANKIDGEKAVKRDILRVFTSPQDLFPHGSRIAALDTALKACNWTKSVGIIQKIQKFNRLQAAESPDRATHNRYKNSRGRVTTKSGPFVIIRDPQRLADYIKSVQGHVGSAKASWLAAAKKFGAKGSASWVTRHGESEGSAVDALRDGSGYVESISRNKAAESLEEQHGIVDRALKNVEKHLTVRLEKTLEKMAKNF